MLRYQRNLREAYSSRKKNELRNCSGQNIKPITVDEMRIAEREVLKYVQSTNFTEELNNCRESSNETSKPTRKTLVKKSSAILKLDLILVDCLLRVGGRLRRASIPEDAKHQVIVPKRHHVTELIVRHYHEMSGHSGREYVLSLLRGKFWVIEANSAVRRLLGRCVDCRRRQGSRGEQKMADLPID